MADRKPPRIDGDDRRVLGALLQFQRDSLASKIDGVDEWDARRALVSSGTSLLWLARHMAHLLQETARHAGHADILREQIDGATGR